MEEAVAPPKADGTPASKLFCAAPWLESVLYNDGAYRICSRNSRSFGDWREKPLAETWKGEELREFRRKIAAGEYPDGDCRGCHQAGTSQSLGRILTTPLHNALRFLVLRFYITYDEYLYLEKIPELFELAAPDAMKRLTEYELQLKFLMFRFRLEGHGLHLPKLYQLNNIISIVKAFHEGDEAPPVVGPFRQVQLIAKCNARCVMCPGKFSGEIVTGGAIDPSELDRAMDSPRDIVDFFCNGSEFLLFKGWREVAQRLKGSGVANLRLSTNGMLLTKETAEFLVDHDVAGHLNVSLNAGTKETLERVQKNVRWDRLMENIRHLIAYAEEKKVYFPMSFSFIVMRSNFHELPEFMRLVAGWKRGCATLKPHVMIMSLENAGEKDYRHFLYEEHPAFAPREEMVKAFAETAEIADREGIQAELYNFGPVKTLPGFVAAGFPLPEFFHHEGADRENIEICVRRVLEPFYARELEALDPQAPARLAAVTTADVPAEGTSMFARLWEKFPAFRAYYEEYFAQWRGKLCQRLVDHLPASGNEKSRPEERRPSLQG